MFCFNNFFKRRIFISWIVIELTVVAALLSYSIVYNENADDYAKQLEVNHGVVMIAGYIFDLILSKLIFCEGSTLVCYLLRTGRTWVQIPAREIIINSD